jgi:hypothetical protein
MKALLAASLFACACQALACGACKEDKIAATYDHEVVQRANAARHLIVYCEVEGSATADQLKTAASIKGVDRSTIRTSAESAALSFALDPTVVTPEKAATEISGRLKGGARLVLLKTESP